MSSDLRILIGVVVLAVVAGGLYLFFGRGDGGEVPDTVPEVVEAAPVEPTPSLEERLSERLKGTTLAGSDAVVREVVAVLSSQPEVVVWLANEDLVRRFVASVHLIAEGKSPRTQLEFLKPKGRFSGIERNDGWLIDPKSYRRYDLVAQSFAGLDTDGTVRVFKELEPLIDEAHREIAPPGTTFKVTLKNTFDVLLAVPVIEGDVALQPKVVSFAYGDERLEGLSEAQKQLLRMGPKNVALIQAKIGELAAALGP
ncbi:MAG: DUF3014 domain-containing protein [Acidobacteria bacterium]|nr:DUF3014 domain-containing protein [Acidobacteriota bacterium]